MMRGWCFQARGGGAKRIVVCWQWLIARAIAYAADETLKELSHLLADRGGRAKHPPATTLSWYQDNVKRVEPAPLGKQRSRDAKDDPYLACALGAGAKIIVTRDDDLLVLGKHFGIQIITPRELLVRLSRRF